MTLRDELGYLDREQLYALSRLLLDEEQQGILMSLAKNYDKVNKERLGKICNKVFTEKELINAVRRIKEDSVFKLRESGHYYAIYRVLTSQIYSKTLFRNSQDFKRWLTDVVGSKGNFSQRVHSPILGLRNLDSLFMNGNIKSEITNTGVLSMWPMNSFDC